jgi:hypothetical protein
MDGCGRTTWEGKRHRYFHGSITITTICAWLCRGGLLYWTDLEKRITSSYLSGQSENFQQRRTDGVCSAIGSEVRLMRMRLDLEL